MKIRRHGFLLLVAVIAVACLSGCYHAKEKTKFVYAEPPAPEVTQVGDYGVGEGVSYGGLTIFPILGASGSDARVVVAEDALEAGLVEITEINEGGSVPLLHVANKSGEKLLIIGGDEFVGARQNRMSNLSLIVEAGEEMDIPVSCVEAGRWTYNTRQFSKGNVANTKLRSMSVYNLQRNIKDSGRYDAGQSEVWDSVAKTNLMLGVSADTGAMNDAFAQKEDRLKEYKEAFPLPEGAVGYLAFSGEEFLGGDIFGSHDILAVKWEKLLDAAALDVISAGKTDAGAASIEKAAEILQLAFDSIGDSYELPGVGEAKHIEAEDLAGNLLLLNGKTVHMSVFPIVESPNSGLPRFMNALDGEQQNNQMNQIDSRNFRQDVQQMENIQQRMEQSIEQHIEQQDPHIE